MVRYIVERKVKKWGHSLIVVLGRNDREITGIRPGDNVTVVVDYKKGDEKSAK